MRNHDSFVARQYADFEKSEEERTGISFEGQQEEVQPYHCLHCGHKLDYDNGQWKHHGVSGADHVACPYRINPENWR